MSLDADVNNLHPDVLRGGEANSLMQNGAIHNFALDTWGPNSQAFKTGFEPGPVSGYDLPMPHFGQGFEPTGTSSSGGQGGIDINIGDGGSNSPSASQGPTTYNFNVGSENTTPAATTGTTYNINFDAPPSGTGGQSPDININIGGDANQSMPTAINFNFDAPPSATGGQSPDITINIGDGQPQSPPVSSPLLPPDIPVLNRPVSTGALSPELNNLQAQGQAANDEAIAAGQGNSGGIQNALESPFPSSIDPSTNPVSQAIEAAAGATLPPGSQNVIASLDPTNPKSVLDPSNEANPINAITNPSNPNNPATFTTNLVTNPVKAVTTIADDIGSFFSSIF